MPPEPRTFPSLPGPVTRTTTATRTASGVALLNQQQRGPDLPGFMSTERPIIPPPPLPEQDGGDSETPAIQTAPDGEARPEAPTQAQRRSLIEKQLFGQVGTGFYYEPTKDDYPARYYFELYEDYTAANINNPTDAVSLQYIHSITKQEPVALIRTRGMDNSVYQENEGFVQATFNLRGRSGDRLVDLVRFQKLRNFMNTYAEKMKENKNALVRSRNTQLILHFPFEAESYFCDIVDFQYTRTAANSPCSFEFSMTVVTNGRVQRKWVLPMNASNALKNLRSSFDRYHKVYPHPCVAQADEELRKLPPEFDPITVEKITGPLEEAVSLTQEEVCFDTAAGLTAQLEWMIWANTLPVTRLAWARNQFLYTLMFAADISDAGQMTSGASLRPCVVPVYNIFLWIPWILGVVRRGTTDATVPGLPIPTEVFVCTQGRTNCFDIAETVYGDRSRADDIVTYNGFLDAYTQNDGNPIDVGDVLYIPRPTGAIVRDGDVYGTDLRLVDGDLVAVGTSDIATITGYDCYAQNINHRMQTIQGENKPYPNYGLRAYVGQSQSSDVPADLRANVRGQLLADHRTDRILEMRLTELGDKVHVDVTLKPVGAEPAKVEFVYNLVS